MKRIALLVLVSSMFTGCASNNLGVSLGEPSFGAKLLCANGICSDEVTQWKNKKMLNSAKAQCNSMGFQAGTIPHSQCVQNVIISTRNQQATERAAAQVSHAQFMNNLNQTTNTQNSQDQGYRNYSCQPRLGGRVECTGY